MRHHTLHTLIASFCSLSALVGCHGQETPSPMTGGGVEGGARGDAGLNVNMGGDAEAGSEAGEMVIVEGGETSAGDVAGGIAGEVAGDAAGEAAGDIAGESAGEAAGDVAGALAGEALAGCAEGDTRRGDDSCGASDLGQREQLCVEGVWTNTEVCLDDQLHEALIEQVTTYLATPHEQRAPFAEQSFAQTSLNQVTATRVEELLWGDYEQRLTETARADHDLGEITVGETTMRYRCFEHGSRPDQGWTLYLSMHGGGGAPAQVNDQQWSNQQRLYDSTGLIQEGLYCAPRAPTDTWNMWHRAHIDALFTQLISRLIVLESVNPHRVMLMGYSAGGDGVYQLAPRMADQIAAAAMSAGHPNNASPYGLRNIGFTIHMGALDTAYNRAGVAAEWAQRLAQLQSASPEGSVAYQHEVMIHEGVGHWMSLRDAVAFNFMRPFTRSITPEVIHWQQSPVLHERFYWLGADQPSAGDRVAATQEGQRFTITPEQPATLSLWLRDDQVNLDQEIEVYHQGEVIYQGRVSRTASAIYRSLTERGDPAAIARAHVALPPIEP